MTPPLDRAAFLRPIAHRGLHGDTTGWIENTGAAFEAAIAKGFGVECDVRPAAGGYPVVFHDAALGRLVEGAGPITAFTASELSRLRYRDGAPVLSFAELLDLAGGRAPLLVELKSHWGAPDPAFVRPVAAAASGYTGPIAVMSFDPDLLAAFAALVPDVPRGLVAQDFWRESWWRGCFDERRAERLSHLLEWRRANPSFAAYDVRDLPTPVTRFLREALEVPVFAWTVRTPEGWRIASNEADAAIFEGEVPAGYRTGGA